MRPAKDFFRPLAVGAPEPRPTEIPFPPSRMIHFFPPSNEKMRAKVPEIAPTVDILLANLEDGVPADQKEAARAGLVEVAQRPRRLRRDPVLDAGQQPRLAVGARRPHRGRPRSRRRARRDHDPQGRGPRGHPLRRSPARPARGQGRSHRADARPRHPRDGARRGQRRGDLWCVARGCRACRSVRPTSRRTAG